MIRAFGFSLRRRRAISLSVLVLPVPARARTTVSSPVSTASTISRCCSVGGNSSSAYGSRTSTPSLSVLSTGSTSAIDVGFSVLPPGTPSGSTDSLSLALLKLLMISSTFGGVHGFPSSLTDP